MSRKQPSKPYTRSELLAPRKAQEALQPFLDFGNLLEPSRELLPPWMLPDQGFGGRLCEELSAKVREQFPVPPDVISQMKRRGRVAGWLPDFAFSGGGWRLDILTLYEQFHAIRDTLRRIVDWLSESLADRPQRSLTVQTPSARQLKVRQDGGVQQSGDVYDGFLALLEYVEVRRIRACPVCRKFYYAWRSDKEACSPGCCNRWSVRKSRAPEKTAQYKINRIKKAEAREQRSSRSRT
jgi:hypothetical protein